MQSGKIYISVFWVSCFCFFNQACFSQIKDTTAIQPVNGKGKVSFITTIHKSAMTKEGIYLNGYVVNISRKKIEELDGKKVKITGMVTIVKGLKDMAKEYDKNEVEIVKQGRQEDTRYIQSPEIEFADN